MIEPLVNTPRWRSDPMANTLRNPRLEEVAAKLNEVIEAVNAIQQFLNRQNLIQPPFPPVVAYDPNGVDIGWMVQKTAREVHEQTFGKDSVPEAEPQEQELSLGDALNLYKHALLAVHHTQWGNATYGDKAKALEEAEARIFAAAYREYAQSGKGAVANSSLDAPK